MLTTEQYTYQEHTLYYLNLHVEPSISITNALADLGSKTFPIADITSVSMIEIPTNKFIQTLGFEFMVMGPLLGIVIALVCPSFVFYTIGVLVTLLFFGSGIWVRSLSRPKYVVKISTASGVYNALTSTNRMDIEEIVISTKKAIDELG
jgi:hypothetical protein